MKGHETESDLAALEQARAATRARPSDAEAWIRLGRLLHEPGHQDEEAIGALNRALEANPTSVTARYWLAELQLLDFHDAKAAERILREALELDPNSAACLTLLVSARRDLDAPPEEILELARRAVEAAPDWRTPREQLVTALIDAGRRHEARNELRALEALPLIPVPDDRFEAEFELSVTGRSRPIFDVWLERTNQRLEAPPLEN